MPLLETKGAASAQGFGLTLGSSGPVTTYIEDVFSTWLYTGNGSTQTITNGIDLSGKGGLVWLKSRSNAQSNALFDTNRGAGQFLASNSVAGQTLYSGMLSSFTSTGFSLGSDSETNNNTYTYASWTIREQPKFFDVVTYTGDGSLNRNISHSLGSAPGCIIVKCTSTTAPWKVYHRSSNSSGPLLLNTTDAAGSAATYVGGVFGAPSSTTFNVQADAGSVANVNANGATYVAYLFAHNAGGFGLSGTDNVISCGSYTGNGSATGPTITLGYEPQWLMIKNASGTGNWNIIDNMRGMPVGSADAFLEANTSDAEATADWVSPTATGFNIVSTSSEVNTNTSTYIYIAIRRGPMKVPTSGTSVFSPLAYSGLVPGSGNVTRTSGFPIDFIWARLRNGTVSFGAGNSPTGVLTRLTGGLWAGSTTAATPIMATLSTDPETTQNTGIFGASNTGFVTTGNTGGLAVDTGSGEIYVAECFRRAPGFFDVVCYTGDSTTPRNITHNLGAVPELILVKSRSNARGWTVYSSAIGAGKYLILNGTNAALTDITMWANTAPTSSVFTVGNPFDVNNSGYTYVAYLFATCAGVSKVGSYTGTGALQTVDCGFTGGARFVLIKRTDSTGDWYVYDSARGISSGNDPYLLLNSTAAEVTGTNYVDTTSVGFQVTAAAPAGLNANGGTYIFLAIA